MPKLIEGYEGRYAKAYAKFQICRIKSGIGEKNMLLCEEYCLSSKARKSIPENTSSVL